MIIRKPLITEKSLKETALNRYSFLVDPQATKGQIKSEIESLFKVNVVNVKTSIYKPRRFRSARTGHYRLSRSYKKAVVELKPKQSIKYFETK